MWCVVVFILFYCLMIVVIVGDIVMFVVDVFFLINLWIDDIVVIQVFCWDNIVIC